MRTPQKARFLSAAQLLGNGQLEEKGLRFHLKTPPYYHHFFVLAESSENFFGNLTPLPCEVLEEEKGYVSLFVSNEELKRLPAGDACYRFTISPKEDPSIVLETTPLKISIL